MAGKQRVMVLPGLCQRNLLIAAMAWATNICRNQTVRSPCRRMAALLWAITVTTVTIAGTGERCPKKTSSGEVCWFTGRLIGTGGLSVRVDHGVMECWSIDLIGITPLLQYSRTPVVVLGAMWRFLLRLYPLFGLCGAYAIVMIFSSMLLALRHGFRCSGRYERIW